MELQFGEGGKDSKLFVSDLFAAYALYAKARGIKSELLDSRDGHITARFYGPGVWKAFQDEAGKHCVQRCPPTERSGRRHTSMVSVAILPLPDERTITKLPEAEVEIGFTTGTGPGGQHRNKTQSAVRAVHKPTGLMCVIDGRDQHHNKRMALRILAARVSELQQAKRDAEYGANRRAQMDGGGRSNKIRTYNFIDSRAVDHRTGKKTSQVREVVEKGRFELVQ